MLLDLLVVKSMLACSDFRMVFVFLLWFSLLPMAIFRASSLSKSASKLPKTETNLPAVVCLFGSHCPPMFDQCLAVFMRFISKNQKPCRWSLALEGPQSPACFAASSRASFLSCQIRIWSQRKQKCCTYAMFPQGLQKLNPFDDFNHRVLLILEDAGRRSSCLGVLDSLGDPY